MDLDNLQFFVYGMCIMFYTMMGWIFCWNKTGLARKLMGVLMFLVAAQYVKDLALLHGFYSGGLLEERIASSLDIVTVPIYVFVMIELCRPGWMSVCRGLLFELPFVLLAALFIITHAGFFFYTMVFMSVALGVWCALWTLCELPRYHRWLKEEYSYEEDINLHWMRGVMVLFFIILLVWAVSNVYMCQLADIVYMVSSLAGWGVVCYFVNKQEIVLREVKDDSGIPQMNIQDKTATGNDSMASCSGSACQSQEPSSSAADTETFAILRQRMKVIFEEQKIFLNPKLRLSELAAMLGTNRTYLSQYFNQECEKSFYEYVNDYRVRYSMQLLLEADYTLEVIASMSGFNSLSTFRRAFVQINGCSPLKYKADKRMQHE